MRVTTRKPPPLGLAEGDVVDGYLVEDLVADRGRAELVCEAIGPDAEPVTLVVAWRRPSDHHAWPRIRRLARTRAALQHEALLPVLAVGEHFGRPYLAMDRYPETTFEDLLTDAPLPAGQALTLLAPVCDALDLAHASGLVHQNLSGASLLVRDQTALLDGFGVAGGPRESAGVHDIRYCAPEELRSEALTPASNVYSMTALLVHAFTGAPPFAGTPAFEAYGHLMEPAPRPSAHMPQLGTAFDDVIAHGMAKDPAERPASVGELLLEAAVALDVALPEVVGSGPGAEPGRGRSARIRIRRVSRAAVIATAVVAALAGVAAGAVLQPFDGGRDRAAGPSADARALKRLDDQRSAPRAALSGSETPQEQAAAAAELAGTYGRAADVLASPRLASAARAAERAYDDLGAAAGAGSAERFDAASEEILRADARIASLTGGSR